MILQLVPSPGTAERIDIQDQLAARLDVQGHVVQRLLKSYGPMAMFWRWWIYVDISWMITIYNNEIILDLFMID